MDPTFFSHVLCHCPLLCLYLCHAWADMNFELLIRGLAYCVTTSFLVRNASLTKRSLSRAGFAHAQFSRGRERACNCARCGQYTIFRRRAKTRGVILCRCAQRNALPIQSCAHNCPRMRKTRPAYNGEGLGTRLTITSTFKGLGIYYDVVYNLLYPYTSPL